jgi:hypothetical protein
MQATKTEIPVPCREKETVTPIRINHYLRSRLAISISTGPSGKMIRKDIWQKGPAKRFSAWCASPLVVFLHWVAKSHMIVGRQRLDHASRHFDQQREDPEEHKVGSASKQVNSSNMVSLRRRSEIESTCFT